MKVLTAILDAKDQFLLGLDPAQLELDFLIEFWSWAIEFANYDLGSEEDKLLFYCSVAASVDEVVGKKLGHPKRDFKRLCELAPAMEFKPESYAHIIKVMQVRLKQVKSLAQLRVVAATSFCHAINLLGGPNASVDPGNCSCEPGLSIAGVRSGRLPSGAPGMDRTIRLWRRPDEGH